MSRDGYPETVKATIMAELLSGRGVLELSREYEIPQGTISKWKNHFMPDVIGAKKERIGTLLIEMITINLETMNEQSKTFRDPNWIKSQSAESIGILYGILADKTLRLCEALARNEQTADEVPALASGSQS